MNSKLETNKIEFLGQKEFLLLFCFGGVAWMPDSAKAYKMNRIIIRFVSLVQADTLKTSLSQGTFIALIATTCLLLCQLFNEVGGGQNV